MKTGNNLHCHSERSRGIPLDQHIGSETTRNRWSFCCFFSFFFGLKRGPERDISTPLSLRSIGQKRNFHAVPGFTLVELIVVITILVILGTIAFLNLGSFQGSARDSSRVSDMTSISKGLDILFAKNGTMPSPDANMVTITASGNIIGYQGYVGSSVLSRIKMSEAKDPLDKKYYTYLVNSDYTKYQVLGLLEDSSTLTTFVPSVYAGYDTRIPTTKGSALGVLLGNTGSSVNQPVQENYSASFTGVEIFTATSGLYKAILSSKSSLSGTGPVLWEVAGRLENSAGTYPGCDSPNIKLPNGQVWAACNVGATNAYAGESILNCNGSTTDCSANLRYTLGSYFQWGRNEDVTSLGTGAILAVTGALANTILGKFTVGTDWMIVPNSNLWGGSGTTSAGGTFLSQGSPTEMQGPCMSGYHVPTHKEWCDAFFNIDTSITSCIGGWTGTTAVRTILKLPLSGRRGTSDGRYYDQGVTTWYYSSSPYGSNAANIAINSTQTFPSNSNPRGAGNTIRCLKN